MICPNCGNEVAEGFVFCTSCGAILKSEINSNAAGDRADSEERGERDLAQGTAAALAAESAGNDSASASENNACGEAQTGAAGEHEKGFGGAVEPVIPSYVPVSNPAYDRFEAPALNQKEVDEAMISSMKSKVRPLRTWSFFWRELICCIPIINLVVFFVQAFADGVNFNSRSYARAKLIKFMIITLLLLAAAILVLIYYDSITEFIRGAIDYLYSYIHQA